MCRVAREGVRVSVCGPCGRGVLSYYPHCLLAIIYANVCVINVPPLHFRASRALGTACREGRQRKSAK